MQMDRHEAIEIMRDTKLAALRGPQPDPNTGLARCGCGGKAERIRMSFQKAVACENGCVFTGWKDTQKDADDSWNKGMGMK
mgnify:CR=1 FL=1